MKAMILPLVALSLTAAACKEEAPQGRYVTDGQAAESAAPDTPADAGAIVVAGITFTPDAAWQRVETRTGMRKAQFAAGSDAGGAEIVVFHFGPGQGGSVDDNLVRWPRQVLDESGEPTLPEITEIEMGGLKITLGEYHGTYLSGMPGSAPTPREDWALVAAVIEGGPEGSVFPRLVGPRAVVAAQREAFVQFLKRASIVGGDS